MIDPIDGTKSYVRGIPVWATLLALQDGGELSVAVASAPAMGRRWWASRGGGAFVRDGLGDGPRPLRVSAIRELGDAHLSYADIEDWENLGRLDAALALARRLLAFAQPRRLLGLHAGRRGRDRDRAGPGRVAVGPGGAAADRRGGGRPLQRPGGRRTADGGDAIATNGPVHEAAIALVGR